MPADLWRYGVGTNIKGRVIQAQKSPGKIPSLNLYRITYTCCGSEATIQEQSLTKAAKLKEDSQCPHCRRSFMNRCRKERAQRAPVPTTVFADWPVPPSMRVGSELTNE
jgi:hypothetical protein